MKTLFAPTEDFIRTERSNLAANASAGTNVALTVADNSGMAQYSFIVIGREGSETAELCQINAAVTPGTSIQVAKLVYNHKQDEPVTIYRYNKRKFYGSTASTGPWTELTGDGSPVAIDPDDTQGALLEYTGGTFTYFKATYYNSQDLTESDIADADAVLGDESKRYCSIYAIRKQTGLTNNPYISDGFVEPYRRRAESEVDSYLNARYILPLQNSQGQFEVPWIVENITALLAAGYLDYQEFGKDGEGVKWLGEARAILKRLQTPGGQQLLGSDQKEMTTRPLSSGINGYPDSVDNQNGPIRMFSTGQRF